MKPSDLTREEIEVLRACARQEATIAATPDPPKWRYWEVTELEESRKYGPRYSPREWFSAGSFPLPEYLRVHYLRAVHRLSGCGLLRQAAIGRRLLRLRLTEEGAALVAKLSKRAKSR